MNLTLPFPPSVNGYWRAPNKGALAGRHLISVDGRKYRSEALACVLEQLRRVPKALTGHVAVTINFYPPDRRVRDMDNYLKALLDALTHAGVWADDSQIKRMLLEWMPMTMSSREIAVLVNSKHGDVKRSAERLCSGGILTAPLAQFDFEHNGNQYFEYRFNKRDSLVLVARLSPEFTAAVVDRWQELEQNQIPQSLPEALRLAANLAEEKLQLENQLSIAAPKVEFVDRYVKANGSMTFRQVAKLLNAKEHEFNCFLLDQHIMYRLNGALTPRQYHSDLGRFEVKTGTNTINNHAFAQSRFTPKGVKWVGGLWAEYLAKKGAA